jgi:hypothetical protein
MSGSVEAGLPLAMAATTIDRPGGCTPQVPSSLCPVAQAPMLCKSIHIVSQYHQSVLNNFYNTAQYSKMYPKQHHRLTYRFHLQKANLSAARIAMCG